MKRIVWDVADGTGDRRGWFRSVAGSTRKRLGFYRCAVCDEGDLIAKPVNQKPAFLSGPALIRRRILVFVGKRIAMPRIKPALEGVTVERMRRGLLSCADKLH